MIATVYSVCPDLTALRVVCDQIPSPTVSNAVATRAGELGGRATMLTLFGECLPSYDHPDYQGTIECNAVLWDSQGNVNTQAVK